MPGRTALSRGSCVQPCTACSDLPAATRSDGSDVESPGGPAAAKPSPLDAGGTHLLRRLRPAGELARRQDVWILDEQSAERDTGVMADGNGKWKGAGNPGAVPF